MPTIDKKGNPPAPLRDLSITEVVERLQSLIAAFTREVPGSITEVSLLHGRPLLPPTGFVKAVNRHFYPRPLRGVTGVTATVGEFARALDDDRDSQIAQLRLRGAVAGRGLAMRALAAMPAGGAGIADGYPPAPLVVLSLTATKTRVKAIMGAQLGVSPGSITDGSPVLRPGILWTRLLGAINTHFYPGDLHGILGFLPNETVGDLSERIKWTRDPQL